MYANNILLNLTSIMFHKNSIVPCVSSLMGLAFLTNIRFPRFPYVVASGCKFSFSQLYKYFILKGSQSPINGETRCTILWTRCTILWMRHSCTKVSLGIFLGMVLLNFKGIWKLTFRWNVKTVIQSGCISSYFHQQCLSSF